MIRTVNRKLIDEWVLEHGPNGVGKLAIRSGVSSSMISKVRTGRVPVKPLTRRVLARAIGVAEVDLFPTQMGENEAS